LFPSERGKSDIDLSLFFQKKLKGGEKIEDAGMDHPDERG